MRTRAKPRYHFHAELSPELEQLRRELEQETGYSASRPESFCENCNRREREEGQTAAIKWRRDHI
jgi:hypothetical protein